MAYKRLSTYKIRNNYSKRYALVTDYESAYGKEIVSCLINDGYSVIVFSKKNKKTKDIKSIKINWLSKEEINNVLQGIIPELVILNHSMLPEYNKFQEMDCNKMSAVLFHNINTRLIIAKHCINKMHVTGKGNIINVINFLAFRPFPYLSLYSATQSFLLNSFEGIAKEVKINNIKIRNFSIDLFNQNNITLDYKMMARKTLDSLNKNKITTIYEKKNIMLNLLNKLSSRSAVVNCTFRQGENFINCNECNH